MEVTVYTRSWRRRGTSHPAVLRSFKVPLMHLQHSYVEPDLPILIHGCIGSSSQAPQQLVLLRSCAYACVQKVAAGLAPNLPGDKTAKQPKACMRPGDPSYIRWWLLAGKTWRCSWGAGHTRCSVVGSWLVLVGLGRLFCCRGGDRAVRE